MLLKDLAEKLSVSPASISIVRQGKSGVSPETRRLIQVALAENGFAYNEYIEPTYTTEFFNPSKKKATNVALLKFKNSALLTDKNEGFIETVIEAIDEYAKIKGHDIMLKVASSDQYEKTLQELNSASIVGCMVVGTEMEREEIWCLEALKIPVIILDTDHANLPFSSVTMNNRDIVFEAVHRLLKYSTQRSIGYIQSTIRTGNFIARESGFVEAMRYHGLDAGKQPHFQLTPSLDGAYRQMLYQLEQGAFIPDSLLAENDVLAIGAMRALIKKGYRIPEDIQIIGIDNAAISQITTPTLSTMHISKAGIGQIAVNMLLSQIEHSPTEPIQTKIGARFIQRNSTRK